MPYFWSPIYIDKIPVSAHRTQLSSKILPEGQSRFTCTDLLSLLGPDSGKGFVQHTIDQGHIVGFWAMAANAYTHQVSREDVDRFQHGEWEGPVVLRRRGLDDVLPLWRGGPIWTAGHSWAVRLLLGVRVYEANG